jgi:membrane protein implicated in regulation of membrane protease activity
MKIRALLFSLVLVALAGIPLFMIGAAVVSQFDLSSPYAGVVAGILALSAVLAVVAWRLGRRDAHPRVHGSRRMILT